jgi:GntR family transcriptional repressor for pyruvate dehydrogenase complex
MVQPMTLVQASSSRKTKTPADSRITVRLLSEMKQLLAAGELVPGAKLPPERELARKFGVNRSSLRQVLKVLEIMGVLTQRVGDGTYLNATAESILNEPLDFLIVMDDLTYHELFETRLIVEPELAERAATRATAEDLLALRKSLADMENSRTLNQRLEADLAFHDCIFRAAGNRICHLMFRAIHRTLLRSMDRLHGMVEADQPLAAHRAIYAAICARDAAAARRRMQAHLTASRELLEKKARRPPAKRPGNSTARR